MPSPYVHNVDPEKYTLTTSGPVYTGETGTIITRWGSEKNFNTHLEKAKLSNEKLLAQSGKPPADEPGSLVAGSGVPGAVSDLRTIPLLFGKKAVLGVFKNHQYDEIAVLFGWVKVSVRVDNSGRVLWNTFRVVGRNRFLLGAGGTKTAVFLSFV